MTTTHKTAGLAPPGPGDGGGAGTAAETAVRRRSLADLALDLGIYLALLALVIYFSVNSEFFLTERNLLNIGQAIAVTGILAAGMTVALIAGQLDLTIGATQGLTSVMTATALQNWGLGIWASLAVGLLVGLAVGAVNATLVVGVGINSIIATLAVSIAVYGLSLQITDGENVVVTDTTLQDAVNSRPLGLPAPLIVMIVLYAVLYVVLSYTRFGYHVYATGGNEIAAQRTGIRVRPLYVAVLVLCAVLAGITGIISTGRAGSGGPAFGQGAEFDVLAAVLLGGIGLGGGAGRIQRTLAGVLLIGVLNNGLTLLDVDSYTQKLVRGLVFVLAVVLGAIAERRSRR
ncbi:ABC transporter permease [Streptomyces sp. CMB-StM0423]|uniref:ABC transporter permease n=1 Tax=Streptomyces sp. CMB-StM0423 TaxID=2059884 RepID=UPI000C702733|nr:ABC transporter permease [Streptomyces sp. CMB-StM0423]AUH44602.1 ribose ABC transporter permease [Streptomyces sp. CMB-StM0423]